MMSINECSKCHEPLLFAVEDVNFKCEVCRDYELTLIPKNGIRVNIIAETQVNIDLSYMGTIQIPVEYVSDVMTDGKVDQVKLEKYCQEYVEEFTIDEYEQDVDHIDHPTVTITEWSANEPKENKA
jgi:hypothetical protein